MFFRMERKVIGRKGKSTLLSIYLNIKQKKISFEKLKKEMMGAILG